VRWTAPADNGVPITGYVVTPYVAGVAQSPLAFANTGTTETIVGLTNGTAYTFTVAATNASAKGPESIASFPLVVGAPAIPSLVRSLSGATTAATGPLVVSFVAGANNGAPITSYTATCRSSNGGVIGVKAGPTGPLTVPGLTTGKAYACTVRATNARGTGYPSPASAAVIVGSPAPPLGVAASRTAAGRITVTFTLGANNGTAITSVVATCASTNGGVAATTVRVGSGAAPISVAGLSVGATYTCRIKAVNARGAGLWSRPSAAVVA
jgi:titin